MIRLGYLIGGTAGVLIASLLGLFTFTSLFAANDTGGDFISRGRVLSGYGPLENARVRLPGQDSVALTDQKGRFNLKTGLSYGRRLRVTAGKEGWFNNGQFFYPGEPVDIYLNPVPRADDNNYQFISPATCAQCHVKISQYYDRSKMAHTTSNPRVLQMYNGTDAYNKPNQGPGYKTDNPGNDGDCIFCHAPSIAARNPDSWDLNAAAVSPQNEWDGISCDFCHKIRNIIKSESSPSGFKPVMERQKPARGNSILVFGPYDDVSVPPMAASYNSLFEKGRYCSLCHSAQKKLKKGNGWDWGKVYTLAEWDGFGLKNNKVLPIQTTYQEWKSWQSSLDKNDPDKGRKCQDCHMSWRKEMLPFDNNVVDGHVRQMWGTHRSSQSIHPHQFDGGTQIQLKTALSLEIEGSIEKDILTVDVFVSNTNGGHWVPTGEPMRSIMLLVEVRDDNDNVMEPINGQRLPEWTGKGDVSKGNYNGLPGTVFAKVLQDNEENLNVPSWNATSISSDTRIRPKSTVHFKWQFKLKNPEAEPTAEATLIYRPVFKELAESKKWEVKDIMISQAAW